MKASNTFIILALIFSNYAFGNNPNRTKATKQTVYSIIKQKQSPEWYSTQSKLWKEELSENPKSGEAWLNYYTAMRMLKIERQGVTREDLNQIVIELAKELPESFEYHYIAYWNGGLKETDDMQKHLFKAYELGPDRVELMDDLFTHYMLNLDHVDLKATAKKWFSTNDISSGVYAWNYNMLQSTEPNAILITSGDNDTYPAMILQYAKGIRTDVTVINNNLLGIDEYRKILFKEEGIPLMSTTQKDYEDWWAHQKAIIVHIKENIDRPLYFAVSARPKLYEDFKEDIYNVGMAYKWSNTKFDNIAVTKMNFEKNYLIDYLKIDLFNDLSQGVVDHANSNYLIPMLTLYNHYQESDDYRADELRGIIDRIAEKNNMKAKITQVLNEGNDSKTSRVIKDPRDLEKGFVKINEALYAGETEVTNAQYELFLTDLLKQKRFNDLSVAKAEQVNWRGLNEEWEKLPAEELFQNGHPDDATFPVVNISYEAAKAYCKWLTEVYNSSDHKRKAHDNVEFRLPTEDEWEKMALAGKEKSAYAWGGPYVRNSKGCFLANLDMSEVETKDAGPELCEGCSVGNADGGYFPVSAKSYIPNDYGLYCLTGNVSEMVEGAKIVKGGSWNTLAGIALITHVENYKGASPEVGFRIIMEVK
ncbi:MAG: formylglycine-generating enzyme family protein [Salibacteraceae bacterium]